MKRNLITAFILCAFTTSCSVLSPVKANETNYLLTKTPAVKKDSRTNQVILIATPTTNPIYDTSQMAYTKCLYQIDYFAKNKWAQTPQQMLQPLLVKTLENTNHYRAVLAAPSVSQYHYALVTQIVKLEQDFTQKPSVVHFTLQAQLINAQTNQLVASKEFSATVPARCDNPASGVVAANQAVAEVLARVAAFCVHH